MVSRLPRDHEVRIVIDQMTEAFRMQRLVRVAYFKELRERRENGREYPRYFKDELSHVAAAFGKRPMLTSVPVWSFVEPVSEVAWSARGYPWLEVIRWPKAGEGDPVCRRLRLDRVAVGKRGPLLVVTPRPFLVCGTVLDPR